MINLSRNPAVSRWLTARITTFSSGKRDLLKRKECYQGRGGGAYFSFRNHRVDSSIRVYIYSLEVQENSALVGGNTSLRLRSMSCVSSGGIYFDNRNMFNRGATDCPRHGFVQEPCFDMSVYRGRLADNAASVAGGGLFVNALNNGRTVFGILDERHVLKKCGGESDVFYGFCYQNNRILVSARA